MNKQNKEMIPVVKIGDTLVVKMSEDRVEEYYVSGKNDSAFLWLIDGHNNPVTFYVLLNKKYPLIMGIKPKSQTLIDQELENEIRIIKQKELWPEIILHSHIVFRRTTHNGPYIPSSLSTFEGRVITLNDYSMKVKYIDEYFENDFLRKLKTDDTYVLSGTKINTIPTYFNEIFTYEDIIKNKIELVDVVNHLDENITDE